MTETDKATGVQDLINRLRDDGVRAGQEKADQVLRDARKQAAEIVSQAKSEAEEMLERRTMKLRLKNRQPLSPLK